LKFQAIAQKTAKNLWGHFLPHLLTMHTNIANILSVCELRLKGGGQSLTQKSETGYVSPKGICLVSTILLRNFINAT